MSVRSLIVGTIVAVAVSLGLLWTEAVPLGVPDEWTWGRLGMSGPGFLWGGLVCAAAGGLYALIGWLGDRRLTQARCWEAALWLAVLVTGGFAWLSAVQSVAIEGLGLGKAPYVLYYRRTEGYFWQARYDIQSVEEFLAGYEALMAERDYLHIGTHPPGLALLHYRLLDLCRTSPRLVGYIEWTEPETVSETLRLIRAQSRGSQHEVTREDAACLWLGALLTQWAAVLTMVPLYLFLRLSESRGAAWRTVVFWPLVPALAIFLPKSDVLYPVVAMTAAWLWRWAGLRARERIGMTSVLGWMAGSFILWGGMVLSLAFLAMGALIAVQSICDLSLGGPDDRSRTARLAHMATAAMCATGCALLALGGWLTLFGREDLNLLNVWQWNFANHALFYDHNTRTAWKWLLVNPLELTLAVGAPVMALILWGIGRRWSDRRGLWTSPALPFVVVWGLLWLSGKNMGEAARLWILLMPWVVAATVNAFGSPQPGDSTPEAATTEDVRPLTRRDWLWLVALQVLVSSLTVLRVDGFHFTELLTP